MMNEIHDYDNNYDCDEDKDRSSISGTDCFELIMKMACDYNDYDDIWSHAL